MNFFKRLRSEYLYLTGAVRTLRRLRPVVRHKTRTWPDVLEGLAQQFSDEPALLSDQQTLTYHDYNARGFQYARWASSIGVKKGDVVALLMLNCPEYLATWLGIARAGGVTALLNTNLQGAALAHCIDLVKAQHIIVDARLAQSFETAKPHLQGPEKLKIWFYGADESSSEAQRLDMLIETFEATPLAAEERPKLTTRDKCLYIYTSGTTGLPKAANINHYRVQAIMNGFAGAIHARKTDRMYACLPLYHTSGGLIATGCALTVGGSVFIAEKFSASQFWDDVADHNCTMFQYIGELCRYLLNAPPHLKETAHNIRVCNGNGLRPDIWQAFKDRFQLPKILEWYAATESNAVLFNFDSRVGSVGRIPKWAEHKFVTEIVQFNYETEQPYRDSQGYCAKCAPGEVGEVISKILDDPSRPSQRFEGYSDQKETKRKILHDVFEPGDSWFRTGDLMKKDRLGYFYFIDRVGDTFRWKGENVSTAEVAENLTHASGIKEGNVYGVDVAGMEGRAGMAALVVDEKVFDLKAFSSHVHTHLATYARPVFLRLLSDMEVTGTFKQRKVDLVRQGFDPGTISDSLYVLTQGANNYKPLTKKLYADICAGKMRL